MDSSAARPGKSSQGRRVNRDDPDVSDYGEIDEDHPRDSSDNHSEVKTIHVRAAGTAMSSTDTPTTLKCIILSCRRTRESAPRGLHSGSGPTKAKRGGEFIISSKAKKQGIKNIDDLKVEVAHQETTIHQQ
jgi:hypothetical protein